MSDGYVAASDWVLVFIALHFFFLSFFSFRAKGVFSDQKGIISTE